MIEGILNLLKKSFLVMCGGKRDEVKQGNQHLFM